MLSNAVCKECKKYFEWETGSFLFLPTHTSLAPDFCDDECREMSETEEGGLIHRKVYKELVNNRIVALECPECGGTGFCKIDAEPCSDPPWYIFKCLNFKCKHLWAINATNCFRINGQIMIKKGSEILDRGYPEYILGLGAGKQYETGKCADNQDLKHYDSFGYKAL